ncbi:MAG: thiamine phosphate synthase [Ruminococcus sp.]|nr:thiamine phosphate synthase [Ruminococcus sp.]
MCKIICVTNRKLCDEDFLIRIEKIAVCQPDAIILREKDLSVEEYISTAEKVMDICGKYNVKCILHNFINSAVKLKAEYIHLPLGILRETDKNILSGFKIGSSCHSVKDAKEAVSLGAEYITAGHVYETDCKKGIVPRGTLFLKSVCESVDVPVYAIGGISTENIKETIKAGADGVCLMSSFMKCENVSAYMESLRKEIESD